MKILGTARPGETIRVEAELDRRARERQPTILVAMHSFTPEMSGIARPWHAGGSAAIILKNPKDDAARAKFRRYWRVFGIGILLIRWLVLPAIRREAEVLGQLMDGRQVRQIAETSVVSEATVRTQVKSILSKLEVTSQIGAVGLAHHAGWSAPVAQ